MTDLRSLLQSKAKIAAEELRLVRSALRHGGQKGSALEQTVIALISDHLPKRLGVSEGVIATSSGYLSPQLDVIIYDQEACQVLYQNGATKVIPIEFVFAVGEVKATLDRSGFDRFLEVQREIKSSEKHFLPAPVPWTYHAYGAQWRNPPIASFMFGFEGDFQALHDAYVRQHRNYPINLCVDLVVSPSEFVLYRSSELGADLYMGDQFSLNGVREDCLFLFLGMLAKASSEWFLRQIPEVYRYFTARDGIPNSLVTRGSFLPPAHPDIQNP